MKQIIMNGSPHAIYILNEDNSILRVLPKSNGMIRLIETTVDVDKIDGVPISSTKWKPSHDMPKEQENVFWVVSQLVKNLLPLRKDLLVPKGVVRDDNGNILGCKRLDIGALK